MPGDPTSTYFPQECAKCATIINNDGFLSDSKNPNSPVICWKCKLKIAFPNQYMPPEITRAQFWKTETAFYHVDLFSQLTAAHESGTPYKHITKTPLAYYARLAPRNYTDCTPWHGPYSTPAEALTAMIEMYGKA